LDPKLLQAQVYVAVIAAEGSFSRAARRLRTSQAFLTRQIAELEKTLAVKLFDRSTRRLELTAAGRMALPEVQSALLHSERAWELARNCGRIENGPIRFGYSPYSNSMLLLLLYQMDMSELEVQRVGSSDLPEPRLILESAATPELVERVLQGRTRAAIGVQPVHDPDLWVEPINQEPFCLCIPRNHRLAKQTAIPVRDLEGELVFWIPRDLHPEFYDKIGSYVRSTGAHIICHEAHSPTQAIDATAQGLGLAVLPLSVSRLSRPGIVFRPVIDRFLRIETAIFARRDMMKGPMQELILFIAGRLQGKKPAA
jgi:DNA-binding transcriptional LysR family regulator